MQLVQTVPLRAGEDILSDITRLAKQAEIEGCDMSTVESGDMEFAKCAGKSLSCSAN